MAEWRTPPEGGRTRGQHEAAHAHGRQDCAAVAAGRRPEARGRLGDDPVGVAQLAGHAAESATEPATGAGDFQPCADHRAAGGQPDEACALMCVCVDDCDLILYYVHFDMCIIINMGWII